VLGMYGINRICALIETPYGKGLHDLPLLDYQKRVNTILSELLTMRDEEVTFDKAVGEEVEAGLREGKAPSVVAQQDIATLQMGWWVAEDSDLSPLQLVRGKRGLEPKPVAKTLRTVESAVASAVERTTSPVKRRLWARKPEAAPEPPGQRGHRHTLKPMRTSSFRDMLDQLEETETQSTAQRMTRRVRDKLRGVPKLGTPKNKDGRQPRVRASGTGLTQTSEMWGGDDADAEESGSGGQEPSGDDDEEPGEANGDGGARSSDEAEENRPQCRQRGVLHV